MSDPALVCPSCRTPLRVRDPADLAPGVGCPECDVPIAWDADSETFVRAEEPAATTEEASGESDSSGVVDASSILDAAPEATADEDHAEHPRAKRRRRKLEELDATPVDPDGPPDEPIERPPSWTERLRSPAGIAWVTAGLAAMFLVASFLPGSLARPDVAEQPPDDDPPRPSDDDDPPPVEPEPLDVLHERIDALGRRLVAYAAREGRMPLGPMPAGLPADEQLSWLARLEASDAIGGLRPPEWDRPYTDPANAEFVQRIRPGLLNPHLEERTAPDGRPATHFVGIGGVGADAPTLPVTHSRAGVFGEGRTASPREITDGLANTMLVAPVTANLGSWAAAGSATVRPFTAEPYLGGPDGFGAGSPKGMPVLMADGSVRNIAAGTDPRVIRRMAAIADGLDLALERPGEPGDRITEEPEDPDAVIAALEPKPGEHPDDLPPPSPPAEEIVIPDLPMWSAELVAEKLEQPIAGLKTREPVEAGVLLEEVADLCGVPIHLKEEDEIDQSFLERSITLRVEKGTVGDVLDALLAELDLSYVVEGDGIRLKPKSDE